MLLLLLTPTASADGLKNLSNCSSFADMKEIKNADAKETDLKKAQIQAKSSLGNFQDACAVYNPGEGDTQSAGTIKTLTDKGQQAGTDGVGAKQACADTSAALGQAMQALMKKSQPPPPGFDMQAAQACMDEMNQDKQYLAKKILPDLDAMGARLASCKPTSKEGLQPTGPGRTDSNSCRTSVTGCIQGSDGLYYNAVRTPSSTSPAPAQRFQVDPGSGNTILHPNCPPGVTCRGL
ncbi:MAG: hypothetical protein ACXVC0_03095 [Bdellovibrionota bacterium]